MDARVYACMYLCVYVCVYTRIRIRLHTRKCTHVHIRTHLHIHVYTRAHARVRTRVHKRTRKQRALEQQQMDLAYADFLRQRDYPMEQLGYYSALLRGLPMTMGSTQTTYAQPPSMASQIGGLGLGALSLSKLLG